MPIPGLLLWAVIGLIAFGIAYITATVADIPFDREIKVALTAGIIGSLFFSFFFAPVSVPIAHDLIASTAIDAPHPGIEGGYSDDLPNFAEGALNDSSDFDYYRLLIWNPHERPVYELSIGFSMAGCIDKTGVRTFVGTEPKGAGDLSWAPGSIIDFSNTFESQRELKRCDGGLYVRTLPPKRMVMAYFVVDTDPEENVQADFSGTQLEKGQIYIDVSFMWRYNTVRKFVDPDPQVLPHDSD